MAKTILILAANPKDTSRLRLDQEVRDISEELQRAKKRDEFIVQEIWATRSIDIQRAMLDYQPYIVHFCGHGDDEQGIIFEDEAGKMQLVTADVLSEFFKLFADKVKCVILNACYTKIQAEAIAQHISYVIGMEKTIGDSDAIKFAVAFYRALGSGETIIFAFQFACNALKWERRSLLPVLISKESLKTLSTRNNLYEYIKKLELKSIDNDKRLYNLSTEYRSYNELIKTLLTNGWVRFAAGFKAGIYAHQKYPWCIKIIGMGVGSNPSFFCELGYYLEHERNMLVDFKNAGFSLQPNVMSQEQAIDFLIEKCGVNKEQAIVRSKNNDILILEYLQGIPLLTQTGIGLQCEINPHIMNDKVLKDIGIALDYLKIQLDDANTHGLLHNDPIGFNILFTIEKDDRIVAKLVDFELAQNLNKPSPGHVNISVEKLYGERDVPLNQKTNQYTKNLDQHLMEESIQIVEQLSAKLKYLRESDFHSISTLGTFRSGININLKNVIEYLRKFPETW